MLNAASKQFLADQRSLMKYSLKIKAFNDYRGVQYQPVYVEHCKMSIGLPDPSTLELTFPRGTGTHTEVKFTDFFTIDGEECVIALYSFSERDSYGLTIPYAGTSKVILNKVTGDISVDTTTGVDKLITVTAFNAYGVSQTRSFHVVVCGGETVELVNPFQNEVILTWDQQSTGESTRVHVRGYVMGMFKSSENTKCPVTDFELVQADSSGLSFVAWTGTDSVFINPITQDINVNIRTVQTLSLFVRAKTQFGTLPKIIPMTVTIKDPTVEEEALSTTTISGGYTGPNFRPFLLSPPIAITMEIDLTNPVLSFDFVLGDAFDEKNELDTLLIASPSLGSLELTYSRSSQLLSMTRDNSNFLSYNSDSNTLSVTFDDAEALQEHLGLSMITIVLTD